MIGIYGLGSTIAQELLLMLPEAEKVHDMRKWGVQEKAERFLFAGGVLHGRHIAEATTDKIEETFEGNFTKQVLQIETILAHNTHARICVIGSESAYQGSFDMAYAGSKAALHLYVERRRLLPHQQLVCIAPSIVADAGMTKRRTDVENLRQREKKHPKRRFLQAAEVARLVYFLLYVDNGYTTGVVIRMNGGEHAWR